MTYGENTAPQLAWWMTFIALFYNYAISTLDPTSSGRS